MKEKSTILKSLLMVLPIIIGNLIYAFTVKMFLLPANLMSSGTTGIALTVNHFIGIPVSYFILAFNIAMLIVGLIFIGKKFVMTTILSSLMYPILLEILNQTMGDVKVTDNTLLNVLFTAFGIGIALGIVIKAGASTGGMDIPPLILNKYFKIPVSVSLYAFDFCIIFSQILFHPAEDLLYGILLVLMTSIVLDKILLLGVAKIEVKILSKKSEEITQSILSDMDRGVTLLHGEGGYLHQDMQVILSVVSSRELAKIQNLAREIDPECFIIASKVTEVMGRGFTENKQYIK